jgi:hypothetical protein
MISGRTTGVKICHRFCHPHTLAVANGGAGQGSLTETGNPESIEGRKFVGEVLIDESRVQRQAHSSPKGDDKNMDGRFSIFILSSNRLSRESVERMVRKKPT